jgi:hypothetical protein
MEFDSRPRHCANGSFWFEEGLRANNALSLLELSGHGWLAC